MRLPSRAELVRWHEASVPAYIGALLVVVAWEVQREGRLGAGGFAVAVVLALVQAVALRWRDERPEVALAAALAAGVPFHLLVDELPLPVAALIALGALAKERPPRRSLVALAVVLAVAATPGLLVDEADEIAVAIASTAGAWALGEAARSRRAAVREEAERAVAQEQSRIARELHDVIAHTVSVIVVQAAAAGDVFDRRPDQAREALGAIESAGREALAELRVLLAAVRPDGTGAGSLARLEDLAAPLRAGGLAVEVRREGEPVPVPAGVDLSAYRIVQEALTNALRHAGAASRVEVTVRYEPDAVELDVCDDGGGAAGPAGAAGLAGAAGEGAVGARPGGGHGLAGMRERAELVGGTVEAGPLDRGGYRVRARLPLAGVP